MKNPPIIVWFRQDLRLADNPALAHAAASDLPIVAVYVLDDEDTITWQPGGASQWWLHHSLAALGRQLNQRGIDLVLRRGSAASQVLQLVRDTGASAVTWNRCYEPEARERDTHLKAALKQAGVSVTSHNATLLFEPWTVATQAGQPYRVFTPFWRACQALPDPAPPVPAPAALKSFDGRLHSDKLDDWHLLPTKPDWAAGLRAAWLPGEDGAADRMERFVDRALSGYGAQRNRPDVDGTSCLSPHLHFGEIGPRQIWHTVHHELTTGLGKQADASAWSFLREIGWREFSYNLLFHFPDLPSEPLDRRFAHFPWGSRNDQALAAWQRGQTGYPIVDAGMRQLYATGWMHNRVRMITASFLIKDLMIPWQEGEAWFWDTLVDADLASNSASWQWVAGCGADAAPYFRVFNPTLQGEKFDPDGAYVRRWVPELAALPTRFIHKPWEAPTEVLADADIVLGKIYPKPIVDHGLARRAALDAYETVKAIA